MNYSELLQLTKGWGNFVSDRINIWRLQYFDEINETPVVYHWAWNLDDIDASETVVTETFSKSVDN